MLRYEFYSRLEEFKQNNGQNDELAHYGTLGQKWGVRKWQNPDGTFNEAGKERYFGKKSEKIGSAKSEAKDYLKFRDKMLKERLSDRDLYTWYKDQHKKDDKQFVKNAKKIDKARQKMYKDQLKDIYDDPNELVSDLQRVYKISGKNNKTIEETKFGGLFSKSPEEKAIKEGKQLEKEFENADYAKRLELYNRILNDEKYKPLFDQIDANDSEKNKKNLERVEEIFDGYEDNETEHLATAGIMNMLNNGYYPNPTMEDLANCAWFYAYEDGNQGGNTAEYLYSTIDKGIKSKEINDLYMNLHNHANIKEEAIATLKKNPVLANIDEKYLKRIISKKLDDKYEDEPGYWNLYAASEDSREPDAKQRKDYAEAKKITSKLSPSCGNSDGWDFLNEAIENLDLSATELKNMTQSDWDKINAEINRLKK